MEPILSRFQRSPLNAKVSRGSVRASLALAPGYLMPRRWRYPRDHWRYLAIIFVGATRDHPLR